MSTDNCEQYPDACKFTVPIHLNIPIFVEPTLIIKHAQPVREKLQVHLEPDVYLTPEVTASAPVCIPQNGYGRHQLPAESAFQ